MKPRHQGPNQQKPEPESKARSQNPRPRPRPWRKARTRAPPSPQALVSKIHAFWRLIVLIIIMEPFLTRSRPGCGSLPSHRSLSRDGSIPSDGFIPRRRPNGGLAIVGLASPRLVPPMPPPQPHNFCDAIRCRINWRTSCIVNGRRNSPSWEASKYMIARRPRLWLHGRPSLTCGAGSIVILACRRSFDGAGTLASEPIKTSLPYPGHPPPAPPLPHVDKPRRDVTERRAEKTRRDVTKHGGPKVVYERGPPRPPPRGQTPPLTVRNLTVSNAHQHA